MKKIPGQPTDHALWRFSIISPLLHRGEDSPPLYKEIEAIAQKTYYTPEGREKNISADTVRYWLGRYKNLGLEGLRNKVRKDHSSTSVPDLIQERLQSIRLEHPLFTIKRLLQQLQKDAVWDGRKPSRSSLYRFAKTHHLMRTVDGATASVRTFEYPYFGDLWSADFLHGPKIKQGVYAKKTYLHAIIDDATRYIVAACFHLAENTESLLNDMMLAVRRFGIPKRFYTDNGSAFRSTHLRTVAAKLYIALPHTPPYKPQGRGKIERFFRSVRDGFLTGRPQTSLEKLNADFNEWIVDYHNKPHSTLGMSPLNRKLIDEGEQLVQTDSTGNINDLFRMDTTKVVRSDGCIHFWNKKFEIPNARPGEPITIYYLSWDHDHILVGPDKLIAKPLDTVKNAHRFDQPLRGNTKSKETPE